MSDLALNPEHLRVPGTVPASRVAAEAAAPVARGGWRQVEVLPVGLFASVMGLAGLSVAWNLAHARYGSPVLIAEAIGWVAIATFVSLALAYAAKIVVAPQAVRAEFRHPMPATCSARR